MNEITSVPHLTTALTGPFQNLERLVLDKQAAIETWFRNAWRETQTPFYASVEVTEQ